MKVVAVLKETHELCDHILGGSEKGEIFMCCESIERL